MRRAESAALPTQELDPESGDTPQQFLGLAKFGELREHMRIIVLLAKARQRVHDLFFVPIRQMLSHICEQRFDTSTFQRIVAPLVGTMFSKGAQQLRRRSPLFTVGAIFANCVEQLPC